MRKIESKKEILQRKQDGKNQEVTINFLYKIYLINKPFETIIIQKIIDDENRAILIFFFFWINQMKKYKAEYKIWKRIK